MCLDELSLAVESDVGIVSVVAQISHGQKTSCIFLAAVLWYPDPVDEVHNRSKNMWGTLIHFENTVVISNCRVEVLKCPEVLRPGKKI